MRAMVLEGPNEPLREKELPRPAPAAGEVLLRVQACGVCRTDLHVVDGELTDPALPLVPGHQIVGRVEALGSGVDGQTFAPGQRVGVPWLGWTCGRCSFCAAGSENLCDEARFTGYNLDGGFAEYAVADARYCFAIPEGYPDLQAAPLLCAGLIGYRALLLASDGERGAAPIVGTRTPAAATPPGQQASSGQQAPWHRIGMYGFGAAAHILIQVAGHQRREVYAFTREGDRAAQAFARELGARWAGSSDTPPPVPLDAAIIFAPVGALVPAALRAVRKGGRVVCAGIHMSEIPAFPYDLLWGERSICSVANLTRDDGEAFFALAPEVPVQTQVQPYPLARANEALADLREGRIEGAAVLVIDDD